MVKLDISTEGFFQDWKERSRQESDDKFVNRKQVDALLSNISSVDESTLKKLLDEKVLKKFYDCGYLMKYWYTIHFKIQSDVKQDIVPILRKYASISANDLMNDYNFQNKSGKSSKIHELEESVSDAVKKLQNTDNYKNAIAFKSLIRKDGVKFKDIKLDKSRLKSILELYVKFDDTDYDKKCDEFIFAEDHNDGFWKIYYKLEGLVNDFRTPSGNDAEMESFFAGFHLGIGTCMLCQTCYNQFASDLNWIVKRLCVVMTRYGVLK